MRGGPHRLPVRRLTVEGEEPLPSDPGGSSGGGRRLIGLSSVVGLAMGLAAAAFVVNALTSEWSRTRYALAHASLSWVAGGLVLAACAMVTMARGWRFALRLLGAERPIVRVVGWFFLGEIGKYVPGGVWSVMGRGELARRDGVPRSRAYASVALSLAALYLTGMFVAVGFLPFALRGGGGPSRWMLFLLVLPIGLVGLHHRVLEAVVGLVERLARRPVDVDIPDWRHSIRLMVRYVPTWLLIAGATWAVSRSLTADLSVSRVCFAAVLAWVAGFLAVPVPAGAGVREAVFVAASGLPGGMAATVAVATRLLFITVDASGAGLGAVAAIGGGSDRPTVAD